MTENRALVSDIPSFRGAPPTASTDLRVDGFSRLHTDDKLISLALAMEDVTRNISVLDPHLCFALIECLACGVGEETWLGKILSTCQEARSGGRNLNLHRNWQEKMYRNTED